MPLPNPFPETPFSTVRIFMAERGLPRAAPNPRPSSPYILYSLFTPLPPPLPSSLSPKKVCSRRAYFVELFAPPPMAPPEGGRRKIFRGFRGFWVPKPLEKLFDNPAPVQGELFDNPPALSGGGG